MRLSLVAVRTNTEIQPGIHLLELYAPQLAQAAQPGHYCMVRCSPAGSSDPLLRRPFFLHGAERGRGTCTLLVHRLGRGSSWLAQQPPGAEIDLLGPLGHGWGIRSTTRNALLVGDEQSLASLTLLAAKALEEELAVTMICRADPQGAGYPPALLSPEIEYRVLTAEEQSERGREQSLIDALDEYLGWADAVYCSLEQETSRTLYQKYERLRGKQFAQGTLLQPLVCASGACLMCGIGTAAGPKLLCRDGPVFDLRSIAR